ncbi:Three prime repair exonuclease 2, partial [Stegodyphus mimosarum]
MAEIKTIPAISTLIFMDLETTGLPTYVGRKNVHITELSLLAVDRDVFETDESFRIINKLSFCIRPRVAISPGAIDITRLCNDTLQNQEEFNETIPKSLTYFFKRLRPPICLLAHNGNKFDFPVLQAELNRINYSLESEILCADTLEAFRNIGINPNNSMKSQICSDKNFLNIQLNDNLHGKNPTLDDEVEALLSEDLDLFRNIEETEVQNNDSLEKASTEVQRSLGKCLTEILNNASSAKSLNSICLLQHDNGTSKTEDVSTVLPENFSSMFTEFKTPVQSPTTSKIQNFKTKVQKSKQKLHDPLYSPKSECKQTFFHSIPAKRKLFLEDGTCKSKMTVPAEKRKVQYSLQKLYYHFFGENPPESHYAEADCITLSKVCQKVRKEFLEWIDVNSIPFYKTKAMW